MVRLGELMMILELHRQGVSITAIARRTGRDPKTIRKYIERGIEAPAYGPRCAGRPSKLAAYLDFLRERVTAFPDLSAARLTREIRELGYVGAYTAVKRYLAAIRPQNGPKPYEVRFETPPGVQAQVDFARFVVDFADDPGTSRIVWLFSLVLGHSRLLFARYVMHQDLQTLLRCHIQAFTVIGGVPMEILYDRMKTAVTGEDDVGHIIYNPSLLALARHYRYQPRACRPYRAKTKGKVERPFSYIRQTSSSDAASATLTTLMPNWPIGSTPLPTSAPMARRSALSPRVRRRAARVADIARASLRCRAQAGAPRQPRWLHRRWRQLLQRTDRTRRVVEVQQLPDLIRVLDLGNIVAEHPVLEGRRQYRIDRSHRTGGSGVKRRSGIAAGITIGRIGDHVPMRSLAVYEAIGSHLATGGRP